MQTNSVGTDDHVRMVYDIHGRGSATLVFVHCWACDRTFWKHQVEAFADRYRVVAVDLPGHGESGRGRNAWTVPQLGADVAGLLESLDLEHVILVGHSMGGPVALETARLARDRVIGIVAVDTLQNVEFEWPDGVADQWAAAFEEDFEGGMRQAVTAMFPESADPDVMEYVIASGCEVDRPAALALLRNFPELDLAEMLRNAGVPVRGINAVATGRRGMPTTIDINQKYADFNAALMDGVGHYPMLERPDEFNGHLENVINELLARPAAPAR